MNGLKHVGGQRVSPGNYWDFYAGDRVCLKEEGVLPGTATYYRLPLPLVLVGAPIVGLIYALFLPFIGLAACAALVARKFYELVSAPMLRATAFGWSPSAAYLAGRESKRKARKNEREEGDNKSPPAAE